AGRLAGRPAREGGGRRDRRGPAARRRAPGLPRVTRRWVLVSGDFTPLGGMDRANHALAGYLARREGAEVHLVTHRAWDDLVALPGVRVHRVARPAGSHLLGMPLLARAGRRWARRLAAEGARVVVNGGNCAWGDINWVHYVHAAWVPRQGGGLVRRGQAGPLRPHRPPAPRACGRAAPPAGPPPL